MPLTNSPNHFLTSLSAEDRNLLQPHLKPLQLPQGATLYRADDIIPHVYFPYTGIISMIVGVSSGQYVEAGMLGRNSVIGAGAALDGPEALNGAIAQAESAGVMIDAGFLKELANKSTDADGVGSSGTCSCRPNPAGGCVQRTPGSS